MDNRDDRIKVLTVLINAKTQKEIGQHVEPDSANPSDSSAIKSPWDGGAEKSEITGYKIKRE